MAILGSLGALAWREGAIPLQPEGFLYRNLPKLATAIIPSVLQL